MSQVRYVVRGRPRQDDRPALPAGHPVTWGLITAGTMLAGAAYPLPPLLPKRDDEAYRQRLLALMSGAEQGAAHAT